MGKDVYASARFDDLGMEPTRALGKYHEDRDQEEDEENWGHTEKKG